ncbi:hypothetical protein [Weissella viridescens]|uniref:hypothetical protein n=1 Tax=Weissella viridescens TaxID=1629 RepID=UPI00405682DB
MEQTLYGIYDKNGDTAFIGTSNECYQFLGMKTVDVFHCAVSRQSAGTQSRTIRGYEIVRIEGD